MLRRWAMLRMAVVMAALLSSTAALPLMRGGEDLMEAGMHRKELPHRVETVPYGGEELRAVPPEVSSE